MTGDASIEADLVRKARIGNHQAFGALVEPYQAELRRHCYRMTGSIDDADDIVQKTLFRAWRALGTYVSHGSFRAWLYRIATNRTLDLLGSAAHRREIVNTAGEPPWLQPYPHPTGEDSTGDAAADVEAVGLAFIVALQRLTPRQRAALLLCDVLGFSAAEAAETLASTVPSTNSLLQRARASLASVDPSRRVEPDSADQALLAPHELEFVGASSIVQLLLDQGCPPPTSRVGSPSSRTTARPIDPGGRSSMPADSTKPAPPSTGSAAKAMPKGSVPTRPGGNVRSCRSTTPPASRPWPSQRATQRPPATCRTPVSAKFGMGYFTDPESARAWEPA